MRRLLVGLGILALLCAGLALCVLLAVGTGTLWHPGAENPLREAALSTPAPTPTPSSTATAQPPSATPTAVPSPANTPTTTPLPTDLFITAQDILWHPDPQVYAGDLVSFEVLVNDGAGVGVNNVGVALFLGEPSEENQLGFDRLAPYGIGRRLQATFTWVWDTTGLEGPQPVTVWVDPNDEVTVGDEDAQNNVVTLVFDVLPADQRPVNEVGMQWVTTESDCCVYHYTTGSAAARDIGMIVATVEEAVAYDEAFLGLEYADKLVFNFVNRVVGHGGFAADAITISYLDRNYVGGDLANTARHEVSHMLDRQLGPDRPILVTEGLAVYVAGGHYKTEAIEARMAAAHAAGLAVPLAGLADDFYPSQHELSYLEASAFVSWLIDTYGWDGFRLCMATMRYHDSQSAIIDSAVRQVYGKSLNDLEAAWYQSLEAQQVDEQALADVQATLDFYDTARRYQQALDQSAHFLSAWIPSIDEARGRQLVADYTRHPNGPENITLELMLTAANAALVRGEYELSREWTAAVNAVLDAGLDFEVHPLSRQAMDLTRLALNSGYEPQGLSLHADRAVVTAIGQWPDLVELEFQMTASGWAVGQ